VPADFTFTVTPIDPDPVGIPTQTVQGAAAPGNSVNVRPGQEYLITESPQPGYELASLVCTIGGTTQPGPTLTIPPGYNASCTATNRYERQTPPPPPPGGGHKPPHGGGHKPPTYGDAYGS
jgi:hypothetical protein